MHLPDTRLHAALLARLPRLVPTAVPPQLTPGRSA